MARGHGRILSTIWDDEDFLALEVSPQRLYQFLLSQKNLNHAGLIPVTLRRWAKKAKNLTTDAIERDLDILAATRFIVLDEDGEELLIRTFVRNDGVYKQPHVMGSMVSSALEMTSPRLRAALLAEMDRLPLDELSDEPTKPGAQSNRAKVEEHLVTLRRAFAALGTLPAHPVGTPSPAPWNTPPARSWDAPADTSSSAPSADPQEDLAGDPTEALPEEPTEPLQQPPSEEAHEGTMQGAPEPPVEGVPEGAPQGVPVPPREGAIEGVAEGASEPLPEGAAEGDPEGLYTRAHVRAHTGVPAPAHARSGVRVSPSPNPIPYTQPPAPPVFDATSPGPVDKSGRAGGEASAFEIQARELLAALKPARLRPGRNAADKVAPEVAALLADGWPSEELAAHMTADPPDDIRNLAGYLTQRLPAPGPYRSPSRRHAAGGGHGKCPVHQLGLDAGGICRSCAADAKAAPADDDLDRRPPVVAPRKPSLFGAAMLDASGPLDMATTTDMTQTREQITAEYATAREVLDAVKPEEQQELMAAALDHLQSIGYDDPSALMITMVAAEIYNRPDYESAHVDAEATP